MHLKIWEMIWTVVFFLSVGLFACMACWVAIGGMIDIRQLLSKIKNESEPKL